MPRVAVYLRTSLDHPDADAQRAQLLALAARLQLGPSSVYHDHGHARPGAWVNLRCACRAGEVDTILIVALHRVARGVVDLAALFDDLDRWGVRLVADDDGLDTATPQGRMAVELTRQFAGWQVVAHSERTREGLARGREG